MLQRRAVIQTAYNRIEWFSRNLGPDHVRPRHADKVVSAKRNIYRLILRELKNKLDDPTSGDELIYEPAMVEVFEDILAEISAQHEALHDVSRVLMNSHMREAHPQQTAGYSLETVPV